MMSFETTLDVVAHFTAQPLSRQAPLTTMIFGEGTALICRSPRDLLEFVLDFD